MKYQYLVQPSSFLIIGALLAGCGYLLQAISDPMQANYSSPLWLLYHLFIIFGGILIAVGLSGKLLDALHDGRIFIGVTYLLFIVALLLYEVGAQSVVTFSKPYLSLLSMTIKPPLNNLLFVGSYWALPLAMLSLGAIRLQIFGISNLPAWLLIGSAASFILPRVALFNTAVSSFPLLLMSLALVVYGIYSEEPEPA